MTIVNIMDMEFAADNAPDFGSIRLVGKNRYGVREYILKLIDIDKLDLITNAADGSTAFCTDTNDLYILHLGEWRKVGANDE